MSDSDPTDHALAAIASILDHPETDRAPETVAEARFAQGFADADGYFKVGPGPIASIRFKWAVRRGDDGEYFVDETVGENSRRVSTGPMPLFDAIRLVDARESEARLSYEALRSEMKRRSVH